MFLRVYLKNPIFLLGQIKPIYFNPLVFFAVIIFDYFSVPKFFIVLLVFIRLRRRFATRRKPKFRDFPAHLEEKSIPPQRFAFEAF